MFEKLIRFSISHKPVIGFMTICLLVWGGYSLYNLPFDSTPDITNNQVVINTLRKHITNHAQKHTSAAEQKKNR